MTGDLEDRVTLLEKAVAVHLEGCAKTAEATQKDIAEMRERVGKLADNIEKGDDEHNASVRRVYNLLWGVAGVVVLIGAGGGFWIGMETGTTRHTLQELKTGVAEIKQRLDRPQSAPMGLEPLKKEQ